MNAISQVYGGAVFCEKPQENRGNQAETDT